MAKMGRPKSDNPKDIELRVRLDRELSQAFTNKCADEKINKSDLVRKWITEYLGNEKK